MSTINGVLEALASLDLALSHIHSLSLSVTLLRIKAPVKNLAILQDPTKTFKILKRHSRSCKTQEPQKILHDPSRSCKTPSQIWPSQGPARSFKIIQDHSRPFKTLQDPSQSFKSLQDPSRSFKILKDPERPFKILHNFQARIQQDCLLLHELTRGFCDT